MSGVMILPCSKLGLATVPAKNVFPLDSSANARHSRLCVVCRDGGRGFNTKNNKKQRSKEEENANPKPQTQSTKGQQQTKLPELVMNDQKVTPESDALFEQRLEALRSSANEQKKIQEEKKYGPIDYDSPPSNDRKNNLLVKFGAGVAVFGVIVTFALGDFLPTGSPDVQNEDVATSRRLAPEEESKLKTELGKFEEVLRSSSEEPSALEGAAVVYAELGEYSKAEGNLEKLVKIKPRDVEALRLLGEVKSALKDYEGSSVAYRQAIKASTSDSMVLLRGLTEALIDAKKPGEAVDELLSAKEKLKLNNQIKILKENEISTETPTTNEAEQLDPVQIDLLLGKSYSAWGRSGDAIVVYDGLIKNRPDDFRGYLAKGVMLKEQGKPSDAERMFIQARYLAPAKAKFLVDRYAKPLK